MTSTNASNSATAPRNLRLAYGSGSKSGAHPRPSSRAKFSKILLAIFCVLVLSSCELLTLTTNLEKQLSAAGFKNPSVTLTEHYGTSYVEVTTDPTSKAPSSASAQERAAAEVVWKHLPYRFDVLELTIKHVGSVVWSSAYLETLLGPRPPGLSNASLTAKVASEQSAASSTETALLVGLVIVLIASFVVVRASNRRRAELGAGGSSPFGPSPMGGPPQGPPPGWRTPPRNTGPGAGAYDPRQRQGRVGRKSKSGPPPGWTPPPGWHGPAGWTPPPGWHGPEGWTPPPGQSPPPGWTPPPGQEPAPERAPSRSHGLPPGRTPPPGWWGTPEPDAKESPSHEQAHDPKDESQKT